MPSSSGTFTSRPTIRWRISAIARSSREVTSRRAEFRKESGVFMIWWLPSTCGMVIVKLPESRTGDRSATSLHSNHAYTTITRTAYQESAQLTMTARMLGEGGDEVTRDKG